MEFFSNEIASTLQYFTFPLEVIGLTLAAIEVRFPKLAARMHQYLVQDQQEIQKQFDYGFLKTLKTSYLVQITLILYLLAVLTFAYFEDNLIGGLGFAVAPLILIPFLSFGSTLMLRAYIFLTNWVPERSVGTLGLIVAGFGILGEAYQFTTQLVV